MAFWHLSWIFRILSHESSFFQCTGASFGLRKVFHTWGVSERYQYLYVRWLSNLQPWNWVYSLKHYQETLVLSYGDIKSLWHFDQILSQGNSRELESCSICRVKNLHIAVPLWRKKRNYENERLIKSLLRFRSYRCCKLDHFDSLSFILHYVFEKFQSIESTINCILIKNSFLANIFKNSL